MARSNQSPGSETSATSDTLPSKIIIWNKRRDNYSDKQKVKEYSNTKPNLKEIFKGLL